MTQPMTQAEREHLRSTAARMDANADVVPVGILSMARNAVRLLDLLEEAEAKLHQPAAPEVSDELAAKRAERQTLVHLRAKSGQAVAICGAYPVEHITRHPEAATCKRCLA